MGLWPLEEVQGVDLYPEPLADAVFTNRNEVLGRCFTWILGQALPIDETAILRQTLRPILYIFFTLCQTMKIEFPRARQMRLQLAVWLDFESEGLERAGGVYQFRHNNTYILTLPVSTDAAIATQSFETRFLALFEPNGLFDIRFDYPTRLRGVKFCVTLASNARGLGNIYVTTLAQMTAIAVLRYIGGHFTFLLGPQQRSVRDRFNFSEDFYATAIDRVIDSVNMVWNRAFALAQELEASPNLRISQQCYVYVDRDRVATPLTMLQDLQEGEEIRGDFEVKRYTPFMIDRMIAAYNAQYGGGCTQRAHRVVSFGIFKLCSHKSWTDRLSRGWKVHLKKFPPSGDIHHCFFAEMEHHHPGRVAKASYTLRRNLLGQSGYSMYEMITPHDAILMAQSLNIPLRIWDAQGALIAETAQRNSLVSFTYLVFHEQHYYTPIRMHNHFLPSHVNASTVARSQTHYRELNMWKNKKSQEKRALRAQKELARREMCLELVRKKDKEEANTFTIDHVVVYDLETCEKENHELEVYAVGYCFADGVYQYFKGVDCLQRFVRMLVELPERILLVGFNSCNFDNIFLLQTITDLNIPVSKMLMAGNRLLQLEFGLLKHAVWDVAQMLGPGALSKFCKDFKIDIDIAKTIFPHKAVQSASQFSGMEPCVIDRISPNDFFLKDLADFPEEVARLCALQPFPLEEIMLEYLRRDILATLALTRIAYGIYQEAYKVNCFDYQTYSQIAYALLVQSIPPDIKIYTLRLGEHYDNIRKAYFGGMTYPTKQYFESDQMHALHFAPDTVPFESVTDYLVDCDVNSLYPYACLKEFPAGPCTYEVFTPPLPYSTRKFFGFVYITYRGNPQCLHPILPTRNANTIVWSNESCLQPRWYCTVDVDVAVQLGTTHIQVHAAYHFNERFPVFETFIQQALEIKRQGTEEKNPSKRAIGKNNANCVYGKTGQREYLTDTFLIKSQEELAGLYERKDGAVLEVRPVGEQYALVVFRKTDQTHAIRPHYIAAFVTAYARQRMVNLMRVYDPQLGQDLYTSLKVGMYNMDTDSMHLHVDQYQLLLARGEIHESELGKLKNDLGTGAKIVRAVYLSPKVYHLVIAERTGTGHCRLRTHTACKGFNLKVLKELNKKMMEDSDESHLFFDIYQHRSKQVRVDMPPNMTHQKGIKEHRLPYKKMNPHFFRTLNKTRYSGRSECPVPTWLVPLGSEQVCQDWGNGCS